MTLSLAQLIVFLLIAAVAAWLAGALLGFRYPFGFIGAFIAALIGEWLMINVFHILLAPEVSFAGIPVIRAKHAIPRIPRTKLVIARPCDVCAGASISVDPFPPNNQ